jgi:hypothetical protein
MNKEGKKPDTLLVNDKNNPADSSYAPEEVSNDYKNAVGDDAINRFDKKKKKKKKKPNQNQVNQPKPQNPNINGNQPGKKKPNNGKKNAVEKPNAE